MNDDKILHAAIAELETRAADAQLLAQRLRDVIKSQTVKVAAKRRPVVRKTRAAVAPRPVTAPPVRATTVHRVKAADVLAIVAAHKGLSTQEVADQVGLRYDAANYHLQKLRDAGRVTVGADKRWRQTVTQAAAVN